MEDYTTGTGQKLRVHAAENCFAREGGIRECVIHTPRPGPWEKWRTHWRDDIRLMERICEHGVGHPAIEQLIAYRPHGCDGCSCFVEVIEGELA